MKGCLSNRRYTWMSSTSIVLALVFGFGCSKDKSSGSAATQENNAPVAAQQAPQQAPKQEEIASPAGTWRNSGRVGEVQLSMLSTGKFIMKVPTGDMYFGEWKQSGNYGNPPQNEITFKFDDGSEDYGTIKGSTLDFQGGDWHK